MIQNVVFLFSQPRAGSTLLQRMLASHSQIVSVSETWLLLPQIISIQPKRMVAEYNHTIGQTAVNDFIRELNGGQRDYFTCLREFALSLYGRIETEKQDATYFLEKTPRYYLIINEIAEVFPDAKFIFLFRNPLAVMSSVINSWHSGKLELGMHYADIYQAPYLLTEGYKKHKDRSVQVKFENLITEPEKILKDILSFLELEFEGASLMSYRDTKFRRMELSESKYNGLEKQTLDEWEETFNTAYRAKYIGKYVEKLGPEIFRVMGVNCDELQEKIREIGLAAHNKGGIRDRISLHKDYLCRTFEWPFIRRRFSQRIINDADQQYYH